MRRLRILTWHVHGNYLWYLSQVNHDIFLPFKEGVEGYGGRGTTFPFGANVRDVPPERVSELQFDCIVFQSRRNFCEDQFEILSPSQRELPRIYIEHDPPQEHPTNTVHWVNDSNVLLVHVTPFNELMWDCGNTPTHVIEHGVFVPPDVTYTGEIARGIVVINHLLQRGRRLGCDVFSRVSRQIPLDLVGMASKELGGLGEIFPPILPQFESRYRFFFNPIRYTSLGLAVCEAMMIGMPIIGLATTEMATTIQNGVSGFIDTNVENLIPLMTHLLVNPGEARALGNAARQYAMERFHISRFVQDWERTFAEVTDTSRLPAQATT